MVCIVIRPLSCCNCCCSHRFESRVHQYEERSKIETHRSTLLQKQVQPRIQTPLASQPPSPSQARTIWALQIHCAAVHQLLCPRQPTRVRQGVSSARPSHVCLRQAEAEQPARLCHCKALSDSCRASARLRWLLMIFSDNKKSKPETRDALFAFRSPLPKLQTLLQKHNSIQTGSSHAIRQSAGFTCRGQSWQQ